MAVSSTTGSGSGSGNNLTAKELSNIINIGPSIYVAGYVEFTESEIVSPPAPIGLAKFPQPLPKGSEHYVVILTTINAGSVYVSNMDDNDDGKFIGFNAIAEEEGNCMYIVVSVGMRPNL